MPHSRKDVLELATGLQNSNFKEVSELAAAYLELSKQFDELKHKYILDTAKYVMDKHADVFKKLRESGD